MTAPIQEIRALLLQFERSPLKDLYFRSADWSVFMARPEGVANPLLADASDAAEMPVPGRGQVGATAPHLGMFEPRCTVGEMVEAGAVIAAIDVLGRKTDVVSSTAGRVRSLCAAANDLVEFGAPLIELEVA